MNHNVLCEVNEAIATVTINRPKALNALNRDTLQELEQTFTALQNNQQIKAVILTGSGEKAFVAGADISYMQRINPIEAREFSQYGQWVFTQIEAMSKIVIAAINGYALGGGCELAMACDIRVASTSACLGIPEATLGLIPGFGGTQRLPRLVGLGIAKEMLATGRQIGAEEAREIKLVNHVVEREELFGFCHELAAKIVSNSAIAINYGKRCMNAGVEMDLLKALDFEAGLFGLSISSEDAKEGIRAFLEKRSPSFRS